MTEPITYNANESAITSIVPMSDEMQREATSWREQERSMRFSFASIAFAFPSSCDCNAFAGKTISQAIRERGFYWLLFTDGTWAFTDYQQSVRELLESSCSNNDDTSNPFCMFGLCTVKDFATHWIEIAEEEDARTKSDRRRKYESLRREFEGKE